ncbi:hypothetical protein TNCV_643761 [Trichonephila clavipes]|nr:hypothetical protein TNCV_643761 [Trichonephila clavipes]
MASFFKEGDRYTTPVSAEKSIHLFHLTSVASTYLGKGWVLGGGNARNCLLNIGVTCQSIAHVAMLLGLLGGAHSPSGLLSPVW